jgi:hypothetical protein
MSVSLLASTLASFMLPLLKLSSTFALRVIRLCSSLFLLATHAAHRKQLHFPDPDPLAISPFAASAHAPYR